MRSAKPNIGSTEEVTLSHIERNSVNLRKRRENKLDKKRRPEKTKTPATTIPDLIRQLNYKEFMESPTPLQSLNLLDLLLKQKGISNYFGKCDKNQNGPFLFEDPTNLKRLVFLITSTDEKTQIAASSCLSNVACHREPFIWVNRLIELNVLPISFNILKSDRMNIKVKENLLWMIASIAIDNYKFRDLLVQNGICQIVTDLISKESHDNITLLATVSYLFKCLFYHQETQVPYPNPFWDFIVLKLFNPFYQELPEAIVLDILHGISCALLMHDDYRALFFEQTKYIMDMTKSKYMITEFSSICISLARCIRIRSKVSGTLVKNFTHLLQQQNPYLRAQGALGLQILSVSFESLKDLCHDEVLKTINTQMAYTSDVGSINTSLQFCISQMVICAHKGNVQNIVYPVLIEKLFVHLKLARVLFIKGDDNVLLKGLEALYLLVSWDPRLAEKFDDEVETQLEILTSHRLDQVNKTAEEILEKIKEKMEF